MATLFKITLLIMLLTLAAINIYTIRLKNMVNKSKAERSKFYNLIIELINAKNDDKIQKIKSEIEKNI